MFGNYVRHDVDQAIFYLELAAKSYERESFILLSLIYFNFESKKDCKKEIFYLTKASNLFHIDSILMLGKKLYLGEGTEVNYKKALKIFKKGVKKKFFNF